ncbi:MAG: hypothetical protein ABFQ62_00160 [Patescibacteria group bacterium]
MTNLLLNFPKRISSFPAKKAMKLCLLFYNSVLIFIFITVGILGNNFDNFAPALLLLPVGIYFAISLSSKISKISVIAKHHSLGKIKNALYFYSLLITILLIISTVIYSSNFLQLLFTLIFLPFLFYFLNDSYDHKKIKQNFLFLVNNKSQNYQAPVKDLPTIIDKENQQIIATNTKSEAVQLEEITEDKAQIRDYSRRKFLKIVGGSGFSLVVMMFLMPQKASASFFGSNPAPGLVSIKDSSGIKIDPAEKTPTDGYTISEIDDASSPSYYGFIHKDGAWYIAKESSAGAYRYIAGSSDFSTSWTGRAGLSYDYFDTVF